MVLYCGRMEDLEVGLTRGRPCESHHSSGPELRVPFACTCARYVLVIRASARVFVTDETDKSAKEKIVVEVNDSIANARKAMKMELYASRIEARQGLFVGPDFLM